MKHKEPRYLNKVEFKKEVKLSEKQRDLVDLIKSSKITLVTGPAGTAKTFCASRAALELLQEEYCDKVVITKPTEIVGSSALGFLPGTLDEKIAVYLQAFHGVFADLITPHNLEELMFIKDIEFYPVQFIRGITFKRAVIIIDEFQSFDIKELMAIVTRFGQPNCKMVFVGDIQQNDMDKRYLAVKQFHDLLEGIEGCSTFEFLREDIVRDPILVKITDNYERMKAEGLFNYTKKNA